MPYIEIKYSDDCKINVTNSFSAIDKAINSLDNMTVGKCKFRAYPTALYHKTHISVNICLLKKDYRDQAFCQQLLADIKQAISDNTEGSFHVAIKIDFIEMGVNFLMADC